jgi:predicted phage tail protein
VKLKALKAALRAFTLMARQFKAVAGADNFTGYTVVTRNGTQAQAYIPNTSGIESEKGVNVEATSTVSVTRTISDIDVDRVRVTVQLPALQIIEDDGDIVGNSVEFKSKFNTTVAALQQSYQIP